MDGRAIVPLLALVLGLVVVVVVQVDGGFSRVYGGLSAMAENAESREPDYESTWKDASGITHRVRTYCEDGETPDDCASKHKAKVDALKGIFPPAPQ